MSSSNSPVNNSTSVDASHSPSKRRRTNTNISEHVKQLIVDKHLNEDLSIAQVAKFFNLSWSTVNHIIDRYMERGTVENKPRGGRVESFVKLADEHTKYITDILDEDCQLAMKRIGDAPFNRFTDLSDKGISHQQIHKHIVEKIGFTLKCTKSIEERRNSPQVLESRKKFVDSLQELGISYKTNCIFVDEAGFNANLIRGQGWSRKGEDATVKTKTKRAINITILAAISYHGVENVSAKHVPGGTTASIFVDYLKSIVVSLDEESEIIIRFKK